MPDNLNLLPPELAVSKNLAGILKTIRALSVIAVVLFLVFSIGLGIFFIINNISLGALNKDVTQLESQISSQETSEQQIVILKDRVAKIETAKSSPSAIKTISDVEGVLAGLSPGTTISQFNADTGRADLSMAFTTNSDLQLFIQNFSASSLPFGSIVMTTFGYSPLSGYLVGVTVREK